MGGGRWAMGDGPRNTPGNKYSDERLRRLVAHAVQAPQHRAQALEKLAILAFQTAGLGSFQKPEPPATDSRYATSALEAVATLRKLTYSRSVRRADPSTMLTGIETAARRSCD